MHGRCTRVAGVGWLGVAVGLVTSGRGGEWLGWRLEGVHGWVDAWRVGLRWGGGRGGGRGGGGLGGGGGQEGGR